MIAATIGRKFLMAYNERYRTTLSAKEFFKQEYVNLFFDHPKYMMTGGNSPLENPKIQWKKKLYPTETERNERILKTVKKIESGDQDASIAIGFPAAEVVASTSGQVTHLKLPYSAEDTYLSWIGSGLGIGVGDGLSLFFDHPDILLNIFKGWTIYRDFLNDPVYENLRGNQINTWNGQWLAHIYGGDFRDSNPRRNFQGIITSKGIMEVDTKVSWVKILIGIAQNMPLTNDLTGYVYNIGQMNITVGFVPFNLKSITYPIELYKKFFGENEYLEKRGLIQSLYGTAHAFQRCCERGAIGVAALEPKNLWDFTPQPIKTNTKKGKKNTDHIIFFRTYLTWIFAMLNNEELYKQAEDLAQELKNYADLGKTRETTERDKTHMIEGLLSTKNKSAFIKALGDIADEIIPSKSLYNEIPKRVTIDMPGDNFALFVALVRIIYIYKRNNSSTLNQ